MQKLITKPFLLFAVICSFSFAANAQIIVKVRPAAPVIVRPLAPSPRHVWVDGDWAWRGNRYEYVNGYWAVPARQGIVWVPGHWKQTMRRGWVWKKGHWR